MNRRTRDAEQPVVRDLAAAGLVVDSVWDLHKMPGALPVAIPILIDHLARDYPDPVLAGVGTALANRAVRPWWDDLKALYLSTSNDTVRDVLAAALSGVATRAHYEDLLSFVRNEDLCETRIYFLRPINRIGNRMGKSTGHDVVAAFADDPVLGREATGILAGKGHNG